MVGLHAKCGHTSIAYLYFLKIRFIGSVEVSAVSFPFASSPPPQPLLPSPRPCLERMTRRGTGKAVEEGTGDVESGTPPSAPPGTHEPFLNVTTMKAATRGPYRSALRRLAAFPDVPPVLVGYFGWRWGAVRLYVSMIPKKPRVAEGRYAVQA